MKTRCTRYTRDREPAKRSRPRVLVMDSDDASREVEARLVARARCRVDTTGDLGAAWRALGRTHYDLLIANCRAVRHCGHELEWWLHEAGLTVPVILTRGTVPVGVINPSRQPASWFGTLRPQQFQRGGLLGLVRKILSPAAATVRHARRVAEVVQPQSAVRRLPVTRTNPLRNAANEGAISAPAA